jgi:hypothetical protein
MAQEAGKGFEAILAQLLRSMPFPVEGKWFYNQEVQLDGYSFVKCRFENCTLKLSRGLFALDHCRLSGCSVIFSDEALAVARLWNTFLPNWNQFHPTLRPTVHEDGTVSVDRTPGR